MDNKTEIQGGCHCGNIQYHYDVESSLENISIRACSCSFCTKQGAIYTSDPNGKLTVKIRSKTDINKYQFASKHIDFVFCGICGVMPLVTTIIENKKYALINITTGISEVLKIPVQIIDFSNETTSDSINRRKSNWIANIDGI